MERRSPTKKDAYEHIIDKYRDTMTDDEIGVFFAMHEEGSVEGAARAVGRSIDEILEVVERYIPKKKERVNKQGEPYKRRLSQEAIKAIVATHNDLDDEERKIISAMIGRPNQTLAALALDMKWKDYEKRLKTIRRKHGF